MSRSIRRRGAFILGLFAFVWAAAGSSGLSNPTARTIALIAAAGVTVAAVLVALKAGPASGTERARQLPANWRQRYNRVGIVQFGVIGLTVAILVATGNPAPIPAAVCLIVGIHFLPLAGLFDQSQYLWTGALLCAVAIAGLVTLASSDSETSQAVVGFGAAIVLWGASFHVARHG